MMMNSDGVMLLLMQLQGVSSRLAKIKLLESQKDNLFLQDVIFNALDPYKTYGVTRKSAPSNLTRDGKAVFSEATMELFNSLAERRLTGNAASKALEIHLSSLSLDSRELFWRIVSKDLKCGCGAETIRKIWPYLLSRFEVQAAHELEFKRLVYPVIVEPKYNGLRTLVIVNPVTDSVVFYSKVGNEFTSLSKLKETILSKAIRGFKRAWVLDAEVTSGTFNETTSQVKQKKKQSQDSILRVFDSLPEDAFHKEFYKKDVLERRNELLRFYDFDDPTLTLVNQHMCWNQEEVDAWYAHYLAIGCEGIVVKNISAPYTCTRNYNWMKRKPKRTTNGVIIDAAEGENEAQLGAVVVRLETGVITRVGMGFKLHQKYELWQEHLAGTLAGRTIEIEYHELTPTGSLQHGRFKRFRDTFTGESE